MQLLLLLVIATVVGYFLGQSKYSKDINAKYNSTKGSLSDRWQSLTKRSKTEPQLEESTK